MLETRPAIGLFVLLLFAAAGAWAQNATLRGRTVDTESATIMCQIRLTLEGEDTPAVQTGANEAGEFVLRDVPSGSYTLRAIAQGFRPRVLAVKLGPGEIKDLGAIMLDVAWCDAPGVGCGLPIVPVNRLGNTPAPVSNGGLVLSEARISSGTLAIANGWAVDLDTGKVFQPGGDPSKQPAEGADLVLQQDGRRWTLKPVNGVGISKSDCYSARFGVEPVTVSAFDTGDEVCVRTDGKHYAHLFIVEQGNSDSSKLKLWHVTHKIDAADSTPESVRTDGSRS